jgi:hypothetical protein
MPLVVEHAKIVPDDINADDDDEISNARRRAIRNS